MNKPIIKISDIVTKFDKSIIHQGVSFSIFPGEIVAIIGGSGSGKTTLLREMLGLLEPNSGRIEVLGVDVWRGSAKERLELAKRSGVLFQYSALFSALTSGENIALPLTENSKMSRELMRRIVQLKLSLVGLSDSVSTKLPSELSGGMAKRVGLARALAMDPEVLFLDEPTSGLDPINARKFDALIQDLRDSLGLTVVLVTHDLDTLGSVVDRIIVLGNSQVIENGSLEEIKNSPDPWIKEYFNMRE